MPTNVRTASFTDPTALIAPDLAIQQQQYARQQALVDALRQQSLEQEQVAPGSRISWTQGLGKLAQALSARMGQQYLDKKNAALAVAMRDRLGPMFGQARQPSPYDQHSAGQVFPDQAPSDTPMSLPATGQSIAIPSAPPPNAPPPASPQGGGATPAGMPGGRAPAFSRGPWSLSGDPQQDMASYFLNPDEYSKAVIASHSPTDFAKMMQQAGIDPSSDLGRQLQQQQLAKQNHVAPVTGRPGAIQRDPYTNAIIGVDPQNIEGANPVIKDGQFTGAYTAAPGAANIIQNVNAAKSFGGAAGDLVQVYNAGTGQMEYRPKTAVLSGGPNGGAAAGPPLGANKAFEVTGANSANAFQAISDGAADVPNRIYALKQMKGIVDDPKSVLGPGSDKWNTFRGTMAMLSGGDAPTTTNAQEFGKWASQYSARSAQELGLSGSDARVQIAIHATPNGEMTRQALTSVIPQMIGIENAKQGYAQAANTWQQTHGPQSVQQFRTAWNQVYDPQIYTLMAQGQQAFAGAVRNLPPAQAAQLRAKYIALKNLGALPQ